MTDQLAQTRLLESFNVRLSVVTWEVPRPGRGDHARNGHRGPRPRLPRLPRTSRWQARVRGDTPGPTRCGRTTHRAGPGATPRRKLRGVPQLHHRTARRLSSPRGRSRQGGEGTCRATARRAQGDTATPAFPTPRPDQAGNWETNGKTIMQFSATYCTKMQRATRTCMLRRRSGDGHPSGLPHPRSVVSPAVSRRSVRLSRPRSTMRTSGPRPCSTSASSPDSALRPPTIARCSTKPWRASRRPPRTSSTASRSAGPLPAPPPLVSNRYAPSHRPPRPRLRRRQNPVIPDAVRYQPLISTEAPVLWLRSSTDSQLQESARLGFDRRRPELAHAMRKVGGRVVDLLEEVLRREIDDEFAGGLDVPQGVLRPTALNCTTGGVMLAMPRNRTRCRHENGGRHHPAPRVGAAYLTVSGSPMGVRLCRRGYARSARRLSRAFVRASELAGSNQVVRMRSLFPFGVSWSAASRSRERVSSLRERPTPWKRPRT